MSKEETVLMSKKIKTHVLMSQEETPILNAHNKQEYPPAHTVEFNTSQTFHMQK